MYLVRALTTGMSNAKYCFKILKNIKFSREIYIVHVIGQKYILFFAKINYE